MPLTLIDAEDAARSWARNQSDISAAVSDRVFFGTPDKGYTKEGSPPSWITVSLVTETHQADDLGLQRPLVQFTCWGRSKALAASTAIAVQTAARSFLGTPVPIGAAVIVTGDVAGKRWFPDPVTGFARYVVDVLFAMRGAEAA